MLPRPQLDPSLAPLAQMCEGVLVTPLELAKHWRMSPDYIANLRRAGRGIPYIKLGTGRVLYRLSEVLAEELRSTQGPITLERIELALTALRTMPADTRAQVMAHLQAAFAR